MSKARIPSSALDFLNHLHANNNRDWFALNKPKYQEAAAQIAAFADGLIGELNKTDVIETAGGAKSLYRIYRDVRFGKDKTPYSTYWGGRFKRAGKQRRGGYYYHFEPGGKNFLICGFWGPNADDLKLIRDEIAFDHKPLEKILNDPIFLSNFGKLEGAKLKTGPNGYPKTHEAIDLLCHKQFLVRRQFSDEEITAPGFFDVAAETFRHMRPFLDYMSSVLAVDGNGMHL